MSTTDDLSPAPITVAEHAELARKLKQARDWAAQLEGRLAAIAELPSHLEGDHLVVNRADLDAVLTAVFDDE